ncbi:MAG: hypothetical protein H0V66_14050 [Bdellovibrionales bacterium]|nr:hypothetical protein [Bdellovibrionales bacterium]
MFKRIITLVIALSIFSVSAMANTHDGLKAAFDEFNYSVTVEWDQKDPAFLEAKKLELTQTISALEAQGMTRLELITFVKSQIKDASIIKNLDAVLEAVSLNQMSAQDAQNIMIQAMENSPATGANWHGAIYLTPVGLLVLVLVIIIVVD